MNKSSTSTAGLALLAALLLVALAVPSEAAPFIYVANAGEDTVSKIDVSSDQEVARYGTWFTTGGPLIHINHPGTSVSGSFGTFIDKAHQGPAPSRIARDLAGNVFVLNRFFSTSTAGGSTNAAHLPVLVKIAPTGGIPGSTTSNGATVLPITETTTSNPINIDPGEATDVRIEWAKPVGGAGDIAGLGRALAVDTNGALWVGMYTTQKYYKVNAATGLMMPPLTGISTVPTTSGGITNHTPYGGQVDKNGKLWSVDEKNSLAQIDTLTNTLVDVKSHAGENYSLAVFNPCDSSPVKVYVSVRLANTPYIAYDPQTSAFTTPPLLPANAHFDSRAIAVDRSGNVVSGELFNTGRIIKTKPNGAILWDTNTLPAGPAVPAADLHGMIVDDNDDVWAVHYHENRVVKYSGLDGHFIKSVPVGEQPYTYGNAPPPVCTDTTTQTPSGCAPVLDKEVKCEPNGGYSYTFTVTNNAGSDMSQILLTPLPGSTFTLSQELFNLPSPLHNGESTTVTVGIGPGKPGEKICFFLSLMSDKTACCIVQVCPKLPKCGDTYYPPPPRPSPTVKKRR
jgi:hypothetical protein